MRETKTVARLAADAACREHNTADEIVNMRRKRDDLEQRL
jgi:hypothetical protein